MKKYFLIFLLALLTASCSPAQTNDGGINILASNSILADIANHVTGDRAHVGSLLSFDTDPHAYQPVPQDVVRVNESDVLILNGLEYDAFVEKMLEAEPNVIFAAIGLPVREDAGGHGEDPHMWLDPIRVIRYIENIRDGMTQIDPEGAEAYTANASAYIMELNALDAWIVEQTNQIPPERKLLATNHESLGYFAERYEFKIVGAVIPGTSTDAAPSAREMAELIEAIRSSGAPAIFLGEVENPALAEQIASETNAKVVAALYLESLTEGAPAATYIEMMKYNVTLIVEALK